jgi:hypothetical protein
VCRKRYKSGSARKLLIFRGIASGTFPGCGCQALDFSSEAGLRAADFNKVIHMLRRSHSNEFQINDLAVFCKAQLKLDRRVA